MLDPETVSVPCRCGENLLLRHAVCPSCRTAVPITLREALEERLASSHAEYGEARREVRRASIAALVLGLLHVAACAFVLLLTARSGALREADDEVLVALLPIVAKGAMGIVLLGCYRAARRAPFAAMTTALAIWTAHFLVAPGEILLSFVSAAGVLSLMARVAALVVLIRGALAAWRLRRIRKGVA
jgi:hypothetical protein